MATSSKSLGSCTGWTGVQLLAVSWSVAGELHGLRHCANSWLSHGVLLLQPAEQGRLPSGSTPSGSYRSSVGARRDAQATCRPGTPSRSSGTTRWNSQTSRCAVVTFRSSVGVRRNSLAERKRPLSHWRRGQDSNPRGLWPAGFQDRWFRPLTHPSGAESIRLGSRGLSRTRR